jgi:pilus assembly protein CpaB
MGGLAIAPILKDEQVTRSKVTQLGARTGLARQVAVGKRAVTVRVNDETGVAKLIKPGDRVDVLANIDMAAGNKALVEVRTILQDVLVLATGKYVTNTVPGIFEMDPFKQGNKTKLPLSEYTTYPNVTLEVDSVQAQQIIFAATNFNGVFLILRNNDDNMKEDLNKTMAADLVKQNQAILQQQSQQSQQGASGGAIRPAIPGKR